MSKHDDPLRLNKIETFIRIINQLAASGGGVSIASLLDEYGFSRRTLERIINAIKSLYPEQFEEIDLGDRRKAFRLKTLYRQGPIDFNSQQMASLHTAIALLKNHEHIAQNIKVIYYELSALMKARQRRDVEDMAELAVTSMMAGPVHKVESSVIARINEAILGTKKLRIHYLANSGYMHWHTIDPYGILYGTKSYLVAFKDEVDNYRYFTLSNIKEIETLPEIFIRDENFSLEEYARRSFGVFQEEQYDIVWRVSPACAAEAKEYLFHPTQTFEEQSDGSLIVRFTAGALLEMCHHLFTWEGEIEIIEPPELKIIMKNLIKNVERSLREN